MQHSTDGELVCRRVGAGSNCTLTPAQLSPPALSPSGYVVSEFGSRCADGALASSCLGEFSAGTPLDIETPTSNTGEASDNRLYHIAPVLTGGWVLLGEQSKCASTTHYTSNGTH